MMPADQVWCRITMVGPGGSAWGTWELRARGVSGLEIIDHLGRLRLAATRSGGAMVVHDLRPSLAELIDLVGLGVEMGGKPEDGEETRRI